MRDEQLRLIAAAGLVIGALLGMAGSFAPTSALRGLAWGIDGTAIVVACALLVVHHVRRGDDLLAAGFLVFLVGESFMVATSGMDLLASAPTFAGGAALWAAGLGLVSLSPDIPKFVRATGAIAAALLAIASAQILVGVLVTPLSEPLPFFAYPFLAATLVGWAWTHTRSLTPQRLRRLDATRAQRRQEAA